jgi:hypothetical protein
MSQVLFGQRVKLLDHDGDTGLRGYVAGKPNPPRDENGPTIMVMVFAPGETIYRFGERLLYLNRLVPAWD